MKKGNKMAAMLLVITMIFTGCSSGTAGENAAPEGQIQVIESEPIPEETQDDVPVEQPQAQGSATIIVNCAYENGGPDIVEYMEVKDVTSQPEEDGHVICGYDGDGELVYRREDTSFTDENGIVNVTITYEFYLLKHDFDFRIEPLQPENGGNIQTLNGSVITRSDAGETSKDFTFETVAIRAGTGIWYAGICSCRDGVVGEYQVEQ